MDDIIHELIMNELFVDVALLQQHFTEGFFVEFAIGRDSDSIVNELVGRYGFTRRAADIMFSNERIARMNND